MKNLRFGFNIKASYIIVIIVREDAPFYFVPPHLSTPLCIQFPKNLASVFKDTVRCIRLRCKKTLNILSYKTALFSF